MDIAKIARVTWAGLSLVAVEAVVFGLAVTPAAALFVWAGTWTIRPPWFALLLRSTLVLPAYVVFAVALMLVSAASTTVLGWRSPRHAEMRIADKNWPLLHWVRYMVASHLVRMFAGTVLRATPVWTLYHRLNGARIGRGVYINSLAVSDDNLLEFGDRVVIGAGVHLSGHTVEHGTVRTGPVRVGSDVTVGVGATVGIDVEIGAGTQVAALSAVPKHSLLEPHAMYGGVPIRRLSPET